MSLAPHTEECSIFDPQAEVRKDRPFLLMGGERLSVWSIYIDNLTEDEILPLFTALELVGLSSPGMSRADARYVQWASPGSDEKIVNREANRTVLDTPENYPVRQGGATMWLLSRAPGQEALGAGRGWSMGSSDADAMGCHGVLRPPLEVDCPCTRDCEVTGFAQTAASETSPSQW